MGTKIDEFDESTKLKSSAEIEEMLRSASAPTDDADDDFDCFEAHTQIGNVSELVARSAIPDPPPVAPRASSNVIRRVTAPNVVRSSNVMPAAMPRGSMSDLPLPAKTDEDAFLPWDDVEDVPVATAAPTPVLEDSIAPELAAPIESTPVDSTPLDSAPVDSAPVDSAPVDSTPIESAPITRPVIDPPHVALPLYLRWGVVAWVVLLALTITVGTMSYMRIAALEDELAMTRAQLKR